MFCRGTLFRVGEIWISQRIDPADNLLNRSAYVCGLLCRVLTSRGHPVSASVCWVSRVPAASPMTRPLCVPTLTPTPSYSPRGPNLLSAGQLSQERALA